jgi:hypothetical protein
MLLTRVVQASRACHIRCITDKASKTRPRDSNPLGKLIVDISTGKAEDRKPTPEEQGKDPAAVSLGRRGGLKGGKARAQSTSAERRREIVKKAAAWQWNRSSDNT